MSLQENKAVVLRMTEEFYNKGNIESADQFFAGAYVHHDPASPHVTDLAGLKEALRTFLCRLPRPAYHERRAAGGRGQGHQALDLSTPRTPPTWGACRQPAGASR